MKAEEIEERFQSFFASEDLEAQAVELPAGWDVATRWMQVQKALPNERMRRKAERMAVASVLARARRLLRHASRPKKPVGDRWPADGDVDVERTLDDLPVAELAVERQEPVDIACAVMLDMSLSMTGEKTALVAVAAAILRLALERVAAVGFDTVPHPLARLEETVPPRLLVRRILSYPAQGYTNLEAGLRAGLRAIKRDAAPRVGVLVTDGIANVGWDPIEVARRFPRLHVVQLGKPNAKATKTCRALARAGNGHIWHAREWEDLPKTVRQLVREVFRR